MSERGLLLRELWNLGRRTRVSRFVSRLVSLSPKRFVRRRGDLRQRLARKKETRSHKLAQFHGSLWETGEGFGIELQNGKNGGREIASHLTRPKPEHGPTCVGSRSHSLRATSVYALTTGGPGSGVSVRRTTIYKHRLQILELRRLSPRVKTGTGWLHVF